MALQGTLIKLADGGYGFESKSFWTKNRDIIGNGGTPYRITHVWKLASWRVSGMGWAAEESAIGKPATSDGGRVHVYLGNGISFDGHLDGGGQSQAISVTEEPHPCPKVRNGVETRWNSSREQWEKLLRKGWVAA
jgi:hypothetical protein